MIDEMFVAGAVLVLAFVLILAALLTDGGTRSMALRGLRRRGKTAVLTMVALSIGTAVIMSSLGVGDALRGLVVDRADRNLNGVDVLVISADFVNSSHIQELRSEPYITSLCSDIEPTLVLPVVLHNEISGRTTARAILYGLDPNMNSKIGQFHWNDGSSDRTGMPLQDGTVILNAKAAKELDAYSHQGLRIGLDSPALRKETMFTEPGVDHVNMTIAQIVDNDGLGRLQFNVQDVQPAAYMTLKTLTDVLKVGSKMNAVLVSLKDGASADKAKQAITIAFDADLKTQDLHLGVTAFAGGAGIPPQVRITSDRVFFKEDLFSNMNGDISLISTYFVDALSLKHQNGSISHLSYSTVTGFDPATDSKFGLFTENQTGKQIQGDLKSGEIGLTNWTAFELGAHAGDTIRVNYSIMDDHFDLIHHSRNFTVAWIADMVGKANDAGLMPDYPGIQGIESCFKWNPPFPMDLSSIQPKDESYWKQYKGIPKAYILIPEAVSMWGNDQGNVTMVKTGQSVATISGLLDEKATAASVGMSVATIKDQLVRSASAMDIFLQMFLAFGTITIAAAIVFVASTFRMMVDERKAEIGTLQSVGISRRSIFRDLLAEGLFYSLFGGLIGLILGWLAAGSLVIGLDTVWTGVIGGQQMTAQAFIPTYLTAGTVALSLGAGLLLSLLSLVALSWKASRMTVMEARGHESADSKGSVIAVFGIILVLAGAVLMICSGLISSASGSRWFFVDHGMVLAFWGGILFLSRPISVRFGRIKGIGPTHLAVIGLLSVIISIIGATDSFQHPIMSVLALFVLEGLFITISLFAFIVQLLWLMPKGSKGTPYIVGLSFMRKNGPRTVSTIGVFALIIFSIVSLSVIIQVENSAMANAAKQQGGGLDIMAEATKPIGPDLNDSAARLKAGVDITVPAEFFMVRTVGTSGAVCSNMNPQYPPRLMGFDNRLIQASDFKLASSSFNGDDKAKWNSLSNKVDGRIPIFVDENTLIIYLGYGAYEGALGHVFTVSAENGPTELVVAGILSPSVIAGNFVMHESFLKQLFPTGSGYRVVFAKTSQPETVISNLEKGLANYGLDARKVEDIVREQTSAEQGYMNLFQVYLGTGLVLGVVALGVTEAREVTERRRDIAMLKAIGLSRDSIGKVFFIEAALVGLMSLAIGLIAGLALAFTSGPAWGLASWQGSDLPVQFMVIFSIVLMAIVLLAAAIPASRASRLAPAAILKDE